ncbi:unnamed protein product, partial [marine sediment metagenome]
IVDKQALFRVGVRHALSQQPDFEVFDCAPNENPIALIEVNPPDVLLLDIDYPSLRGLELAQEVALHCPTTKVIILTYKPDDKQLFEIIKAGAVDYLDKSITAEELTKSIRQVARGEYPINDSVLARPKVAEHLLKQFQSIHNINGKTMDTIVVSLTSRETQILNYIANGNSNKQIAYILQISEQELNEKQSEFLVGAGCNFCANTGYLGRTGIFEVMVMSE